MIELIMVLPLVLLIFAFCLEGNRMMKIRQDLTSYSNELVKSSFRYCSSKIDDTIDATQVASIVTAEVNPCINDLVDALEDYRTQTLGSDINAVISVYQLVNSAGEVRSLTRKTLGIANFSRFYFDLNQDKAVDEFFISGSGDTLSALREERAIFVVVEVGYQFTPVLSFLSDWFGISTTAELYEPTII